MHSLQQSKEAGWRIGRGVLRTTVDLKDPGLAIDGGIMHFLASAQTPAARVRRHALPRWEAGWGAADLLTFNTPQLGTVGIVRLRLERVVSWCQG